MTFLGLLRSARKLNASDIHVVVGLPVLLRIDGHIVTTKGDVVGRDALRTMVYEQLSDDQKARLERDWRLCYSTSTEEAGRVRVTIYFRNGCPELSIRLSERNMRTRQELSLPAVVDDLARKPNGLVIIAGPTGVGKTTTFHYMIDLINAERREKIITIEDPVEFVHPFKRAVVIQQEVLTDVHDFPQALNHALRQDPDVIAIGELREAETMYTALTAAETGHLVIATLHTPSTIELLQRMISSFPPGQQEEVRLMLSNTFQGAIAQQLLPRASGNGRILCAEVLIGTPAVRNRIRENSAYQIYSELQTGRKDNMITMDHALLELYQKGEITYDTAVSMARYPGSIQQRSA